MKRHTAELKEKLIQTGVEEIKKHGIDRLSLRTVAKLCGVTHGTPYKHFGSKEGYLRVVLAKLSDFSIQNMQKHIDYTAPARQQLAVMGYDFVTFAKTYPYIFEALFIKYPFNYMKIKEGNIVTETDLPGFNAFRAIVLKLRQEEKLAGSETENIFHFWSFISGFAILINSPIGDNFNQQAIRENIESMLTTYIKGGK
ncbi:TetR/AcrR family transcriptional regulator [Streptococcus chenjunshii]|uniref:TetR/AcrR family transcriptional regulator n=1 Tax=Streptococcus chenjunshii TaxID=2173853 RepID=A0A372KPQ1_9STRE|nr:TetR/AcrR family transcriptional regulator [Streptococcus chenjunshii]AXQ78451.1 TetR/AcrR family transcriptional regulator [Streptococcus chenjunshii]RFU52088.1 TetR/AcrR family transcriptional regulator [Streptococcus chenjunshii]RFU54280.1 TetR/AcrR family transcriptional regulator [Streptococcus chenjunshii]